MPFDWGSFIGGISASAVGVTAIIAGYIASRRNAEAAAESAKAAIRSAEAATELADVAKKNLVIELEKEKVKVEVRAGERKQNGRAILFVEISNNGRDVYLRSAGFFIVTSATEIELARDIIIWPSASTDNGEMGYLGKGMTHQQVAMKAKFKEKAEELGLPDVLELKGYYYLQASSKRYESESFSVIVE